MRFSVVLDAFNMHQGGSDLIETHLDDAKTQL